MSLTWSLLVAGLTCVAATLSWECYWRNQGMYPTLDDNKERWAVIRHKLEHHGPEDVVLIGSSRVLFDIQLDEWEKVTGRRPLQLAAAGSSPLPILRDIVDNSSFRGTLLVGVTPGLFFSTLEEDKMPIRRSQGKVDYYKKRTWAQRLNHALSIPLQQHLVLMSGHEEEWDDDIDLRSLLRRVQIGNRTGEKTPPPFRHFGDMALDRNTTLSDRTVNDTAFAASIQRVWVFFNEPERPASREATTDFFLRYAKKFEARGGRIILLRCPSSGKLRALEHQRFSRATFWDELVRQAGCPAYHFEDDPQLNRLDPPEWSHLSARDARSFTRHLASQMMRDGHLTSANH